VNGASIVDRSYGMLIQITTVKVKIIAWAVVVEKRRHQRNMLDSLTCAFRLPPFKPLSEVRDVKNLVPFHPDSPIVALGQIHGTKPLPLASVFD
jgi:hypothetical protein